MSPGTMVKDWALYEELREKGYTKEQAARIANARRARKQSRKSKKRKGRRETTK